MDSDGYLHASVALYVLEKAGINLMQADMFATNAAMDKVVDA
ncbi:hypothetical protein LT85_0986 [Collimonas arenae]|uniref:Uncharacterized protein n=1 Tax=Collimonas arenae TaxID=279058 RepID=A0A0A1F8Y5_9BURK|nr:hypothetical protein LT85_0986 [Collimonas arenae]